MLKEVIYFSNNKKTSVRRYEIERAYVDRGEVETPVAVKKIERLFPWKLRSRIM